MSGKWHEKPCPVCGEGLLHDGHKIEVSEYRGHQFTFSQSGAYCDVCNDGIVYHDPAAEEAWKKFRDDVHEEERRQLIAIRQFLGMTQHQASRLAGGGHNAFSRYERGEARPVLGVINLFRLLGRHPELLMELSAQPQRVCWTTHAIVTCDGTATAFSVKPFAAVIASQPIDNWFACTTPRCSLEADGTYAEVVSTANSDVVVFALCNRLLKGDRRGAP
jgi:HTH-type transcriptional regulator / antitoxin MqsA